MTRNIGRAERENIIRMLAYLLTLQESIKELEEHGGDKEVLRRFRTAHTNLDKGMHTWLSAVGHESQVKIAKEAECYSAGLYLTKDAEKHKAAMIQAESDARKRAMESLGEGIEPIYQLTELFLANICKNCNGHPNGKPSSECPAFKVLDKLQVPGWNEHPECQYASAGVVE